ncbi:MAG: outer membrane protein assembly factor BamB family protein [Planctomycetota bacterium]|jgi:outer membrane protein assembly factor BamB
MALIACLAFSLLAPQGQDWPQYRGPQRTGAVETVDWSPTGRPEPLWTAQIGKGYSCPSIAGGLLVTMGFDEAAGVDNIICLDAISGEPRWQFEFPATDAPSYHGGGTLTSPTIRDGIVYCLNRWGKFHALELDTGELIWEQDYGAELGLEKTFHGFSASPLLEGDSIYLQLGGMVICVDTESGEIIWQTEDRGDLSYSNLLLLDAAGQPALGAVLAMNFVLLARENGRVIQEYPWRLKGNAVHCAQPLAIGEDRIFLSTAYNKGCAMLQLGSDGAMTSIWASRVMRNKVTACVQYEDHLYGFDESMLRCIDLDGNAKWRVRGMGLGSLSLAGDRLLILNSDGELIVAEASPEEFREISRQKVLDDGVYWTMPVLVDGLIYVRNSLGDLSCLDHRLEASPANTTKAAGETAPAAQSLFAKHAELVGAESFNRDGQALRLRGRWSIPLRGLEDGAMTWTMLGPKSWDLRLDAGGLLYTFDGERAWAIEPQGPRKIYAEELVEAQHLFPLPELFVPSCPEDAVTAPGKVRFAETECWKVSASIAGTDGERERVQYFAVADGRLVGSEGPGLSTLVFHDWQPMADLVLPARVTRYRAEDGQEHQILIADAEWLEPPTGLFELPPAIQRLMRSPVELAEASVRLHKRFAGALARYQAKDKSTPMRDDIIELAVRDGELWFVMPGDSFRVAVEEGVDGLFPINGLPLSFSIETDANDQATALKLTLPGPGGELVLDRLPE